jgi:hypothetical protein
VSETGVTTYDSPAGIRARTSKVSSEPFPAFPPGTGSSLVVSPVEGRNCSLVLVRSRTPLQVLFPRHPTVTDPGREGREWFSTSTSSYYGLVVDQIQNVRGKWLRKIARAYDVFRKLSTS